MSDDGYTRITLRIPTPLDEKLNVAARVTSKSKNAEIIQRLEQSFLAEDETSRAKVTAPLQMVELSADNKSFIRQLALELSDVLNERVFLGEALSKYRMTEQAQPKPPANRPIPKRRKSN
ncbi:Arc family DNA-binding protein [Chromobacterium piscinae]|uniref:Arc family DNA-binding protein n=1 Tax=Chromobacterium piscinae TaxID=686831 RepID=UPI003F7F415E